MKSKIFLSVIVPCYNEEENINRGILFEIEKFLKTKNFSWEVIVSDDGSTDASKDIVKKNLNQLESFRLLENPHGGKPSALMHGIKEARSRYILFCDVDQSTPIAELDKLLPYLPRGFEVVIGSRGLKRKDFPVYRKIGAAVFSTIRRALILPELADTQCGFKLFKAEPLKKAFPKLEFFKSQKEIKGWKVTSFDVELLHILKKMGCKIKEVEIVWKDRDISKGKGGSLQKYIRESKDMFWQILRVKYNDIKGLY